MFRRLFNCVFVFLGSLCNLYNWRYKNLGNLPHVQLLPEFRTANAGFLYDFQLINVEDFNGVGESEPNPYFYQVREEIWCSNRYFTLSSEAWKKIKNIKCL